MNPHKPTEEFLRNIDIHELLPQQEPFVMVGVLCHFDDAVTITETEISSDNLFVDDGVFTASGLIENVAQTCAARIGYVNKYILGKGIQLGFIGAIRNLEIHENPKVGDVIITKVEVLEEVFGMTLANATVTSGDKVLLTTDMKIAIRDAME
ncbi:MAG: pseudouridylate synthase [Prevotella sp.]|nr:pseudouridylate synthase [Candidatus Prevotella equi]